MTSSGPSEASPGTHAAAPARNTVDPAWRRGLESVLRSRGATPSEAAEIATDVMGDAEVGQNGKVPLLDKIRPGVSPLPFLTRVAINRWIDRKRKEAWLQPMEESDLEPAFQLYRDLDPAPGEGSEDTITQLLRDAILRVCAACPPDEMVLVKLIMVRRVPQDQVAHFLGWSQSKVSRQLAATLSRLRSDILGEIQRVDPWLTIEWEDIIALCRSSSRPLAPFSA